MIHVRLIFASATLLVGGCMGTESPGLESVHQPVVQREDYALDLRASGRGLAPGEQARLSEWFEALRLSYGDRILLDAPDGTSPGTRAEVAGIATGYGLLIGDEPPVAGAPMAPGIVRVVVSRSRASVPDCPDWSREEAYNFDNHTSSNYGCAVNSNLAAMVASPADLVRGRDGSTVNDPAAVSKSIDRFRKRVPTGADGTVKAESVGGR